MKTRHIALAILVWACTLAQAEVGQKPFPKIEGGSGDDQRPAPSADPRRPVPVPPSNRPSGQVAAGVCEAEIEQTLRDMQVDHENNGNTGSVRSLWADSDIAERKKQYFGKSCASFSSFVAQPYVATQGILKPSVEQALSYDLSVYLTCNKGGRSCRVPEFFLSRTRMELCFLRARAAQCGSLSSSAPSPGTSTNLPPPANPASPNSQEAQRLNTQLREAETRAQNNQAKVDRAREGKPKLHKAGSVAHQCLKPQPGGGMLNMCPYAVEYSYCVYRPVKDSWSAAFDCDKGLGGSWQVGPGPGKPVLIHTGGETTYWFACRYGETLHKPDGISPVDIEYQRGRGLLGRCGEWGSSTRK